MQLKLPVNEIFQTVQGEATYTGTPAIFIRLQGCPVGCPWCDTKHTWLVSVDRKVEIEAMMRKEKDADTFAFMTPEDLVAECLALQARHVVITGGEPCLYDLFPLTSALFEAGFSVQIETSGTREVLADCRTFVTVSPKVEMPGGFQVQASALHRANEIKMPVGKIDDIWKLISVLKTAGDDFMPPVIWLQPLSQSPKATALCVDQATKHGWRISIQTHKYLGVR
jgi:7-carboxy-7-deazaguanine synthase